MAACLAQIGVVAGPAVPALLPLLADRKVGVRRAAADALEQIGPKSVLALIELIQARDMQRLKVWFAATMEVSGWHNRPRADTLVAEPYKIWMNRFWASYDLRQERESLEAAQETALQILGRIGPSAEEAIPAIGRATKDPNRGIRLAAVQALSQIGTMTKDTAPDLILMLVDRDKKVREAAAVAMENFECHWVFDPAVAGAVADLAGKLDGTGEIAVSAFTVIGIAAVPSLIGVLESGNRVAQQNAAMALGRIGPEAEAAIPALTGALQDTHPWVQAEAANALEKINDQPV
jgi:HEAT repeat protein